MLYPAETGRNALPSQRPQAPAQEAPPVSFYPGVHLLCGADETDGPQARSCALLCRLGVTANYIGFLQMAYALQLCAEDHTRLLLVTKLVYPDVARHFHTNGIAVERNLRTVGGIIWRESRPLLEALAHRPLAQKPATSQLLAILTAAIVPPTPNLSQLS
ncbi:MAG: sporulation initiation factor Spo0A C-terminal domain-containing protein [Oscillospiraceae bacterium]|nr:sporulation initiation factor Spo0A C-terminal domain-containing protein [Oscillospiraceae bacterium]